MRPFLQRTLTPERRVFNYRLARARRVVENAFGIMARQFRLFQTAIHMADCKLNTVILPAAFFLILGTGIQRHTFQTLGLRPDNHLIT